MCESRFRSGMKWLGNEAVIQNDFFMLKKDEFETVRALESLPLKSASELRLIKIDGADIGLAALGSLISLLREPAFDVVLHRKLVVSVLQSATVAFFSIRNHLRIYQPDKFVIFNGRFAELRGALCAAQSQGIPTVVHERAGVLEKYSTTLNTSPHNLLAMKQSIEEVYAGSSLDYAEKIKIAAEWYQERRDNKPQSWYSFISEQSKGLLPELSPGRCNIVIFNSSEDEMEAYDYWKNPVYTDQSDGIRRISESVCNDGRFKLFLRVHPNLRGVDNTQTRMIEALGKCYPSLAVIPSESPISSYDLMEACDIVISFGSTIGIEAAHVFKPVILLGRAIYEDLGCCIQPKSHEEFIQILTQFVSQEREIIPDRSKLIKGTTKYGFFKKLSGEDYRYVNTCSVIESRMVKNGIETILKPAQIVTLMDLVSRGIDNTWR